MELSVTTEFLVNLDESLSECGRFKIDIRELTIAQIQEHFRTGKLTSVELTKCYLNRISKIDVHLKSVIEVNPDAISLANRADKERSAGLNQNPLHGIPILIKDNIATADQMHTTAGALALENVKPKLDADVVKRLRKVGAIILGKANLSEWANFRDNDIPSGWSGRGGQTINAYVMGQDPLGSSTGSAVSISANLAAVSLGTETNGSILAPSAKSGVVGLKPTHGVVSTKGVIPLAFSNDVVGPMARSVEDVAILFGAISDIDLQGCGVDMSSSFANRNFKIGVLRDPFWDSLEPSLKTEIADLETCLDVLNTTGMVDVIDPVIVPKDTNIEYKSENDMIIYAHEFKYALNKYLKNDVQLDGRICTLTDIIEFNEMNPSQEGYNQNILKICDTTVDLENEQYLAASDENRRNSIKCLESIFDENEVDALVTPSIFISNKISLYSYGAFAGYPSITVPVGVDSKGMPIGLTLLGRPSSEPELLKLAFFIESSREKGRPVPRFIKASG